MIRHVRCQRRSARADAAARRSLTRRVSEAAHVVVVRLLGGAGNELFQYAAALSISDVANVRTIANASDHLLSAEVLLPGFIRAGSDLELELLGLRDPAMTSETRLRKRVVMRAVKPMQRFVARRTVNQHGELAAAFAPPSAGLRRPRMLDGYFQHPGWFTPGDQVVIDALLDNAPAGWAELARTVHYNAVCFRRGDYEPLGWMLPTEYYDMSMPHLSKAVPLVVIGDDTSFNESMVAHHRHRGYLATSLPQLSDNAAVNDFWTLAGAANVVMANSTFCWWATRVGDASRAATHQPRTVVCPRSWLSGASHEMIQPGWTAMNDTLELLRGSTDAAPPG